MNTRISRPSLTKEQIQIRKRFIGATFVTCIVTALVFGTIHVLELGANRMQQMRDLAGYDISKEKDRIRAAGQDLYLADRHEKGQTHTDSYTIEEARSLLTEQQWQMLAEMVVIPEGEFIMGTDSLKSDSQNRPQHKVFVKSYKIDKHLVTNAEYALFVAETGYRAPLNWPNGKIPEGLKLHPVTMVSWFDATAYTDWAKKRLPTEAEWEKAARGTDGRRWPWGDKMDSSFLNTYYNKGSTTKIDAYPQGASPYGVLDMSGNVQEWVANDFIPYSGSAAPETLFAAKVPQIPTDAKDRSLRMVEFVETEERYKVMRGGSWKSDPFSTSTYHRNFSWPNFTSDFYGFRTASDVD